MSKQLEKLQNIIQVIFRHSAICIGAKLIEYCIVLVLGPLEGKECVNGHYVCNECHSKGVDSIVGLCLNETSCDPIEIIGKMMDMPFCHMHGPEHHVMVGAALLTAYRNAGGELDLEKSLKEIVL